jgi:hypothetical protein
MRSTAILGSLLPTLQEPINAGPTLVPRSLEDGRLLLAVP